MSKAGWDESLDTLAEVLEEGEAGMAKMNITAEPGKQEIVMTRIFDAPREDVWRTVTVPELIPRWWGSRSFTTTVTVRDVRPGGIWRFVQRDADGNEYAFHGVYHEVALPERLVYTSEFEGMPGRVQLETVTFEDLNGRTKMTDRSIFQIVEDRDGMLQSGMEKEVTESMDRLAGLVEKQRAR
ncbi:SRPBCC family protein [Methanoculleus taiwanensis]|nr:SRPBCC family protein [Methanoculleus taiwanensis]